ncbi:aldehyde dehydrogenase family protein [Caldalkalibacillus uzonensis]|nr:aldehyde dehydrogenase family protein [Caldalkalibacillus uzonensis]
MLDLYINGTWLHGLGPRRTLINPATKKVLTHVHEASREQVNEAVRSAHSAFYDSMWARDMSCRVAILEDVANKLERDAEEVARLETENTGKPIRESRLDVEDSIKCLRYYANLVKERQVWTKEMDDGTVSKITEEPIGVCGLIVPWNFPLLLGIWKIAPALAAGNTVIFKPAEITPLSILKFTQLLDESGLPNGVFNLVLGGEEVGRAIVQDPLVRKISFTGGVETGKRVYAECAQSLKRISLELGGKSPLLIFDDVNVDDAVEWAIFGAFFNQGQVCVAASRILVHHQIFGSFIKKFVEKTKAIRIGSPLEEQTELGPVISQAHFNHVQNFIEWGRKEGATLLTGGEGINDLPGYYLRPAVFVGVSQNMRVVQEEIFGPVCTVQAFNTEEEGVCLANGTRYGLAAGILTQDLKKAKKIAQQLQAGTIWINGYHTPYVEAPWGGFKHSGLGRELGPHGLACYVEYKHVNTNSNLTAPGWYSFNR